MTLRDLAEAGWHAALLPLALSPVLCWLAAHRLARVAFALLVLVAFAYHLVVVHACHAYLGGRPDWTAPACTWGS